MIYFLTSNISYIRSQTYSLLLSIPPAPGHEQIGRWRSTRASPLHWDPEAKLFLSGPTHFFIEISFFLPYSCLPVRRELATRYTGQTDRQIFIDHHKTKIHTAVSMYTNRPHFPLPTSHVALRMDGAFGILMICVYRFESNRLRVRLRLRLYTEGRKERKKEGRVSFGYWELGIENCRSATTKLLGLDPGA